MRNYNKSVRLIWMNKSMKNLYVLFYFDLEYKKYGQNKTTIDHAKLHKHHRSHCVRDESECVLILRQLRKQSKLILGYQSVETESRCCIAPIRGVLACARLSVVEQLDA